MTFSLSIWNKRDVKSWCDSFPPKFYSWVYHGVGTGVIDRHFTCFPQAGSSVGTTCTRTTTMHVHLHTHDHNARTHVWGGDYPIDISSRSIINSPFVSYTACFNLTIIRWTLLHVLVHHVSMNVYSGMVWYVYKFNPNQRFDNIVPSNELIRKNKFPLFPPWFSSYFGDVFEWSTLNLMLHILSDAKHNSNTPEYLFFRRSFFSTRYILWRH